MKLAYPAFAVAKANAKGKCCERRRRSRAQCLSACTGVVDCILDPGQCKLLKAQLLEIVDLEKDSLRFYYLGNNYKSKIEHYGIKASINQEGVLIL